MFLLFRPCALLGESPDESPWLLGSFMLLRAAVALRSLHEASESLMWQGPRSRSQPSDGL